MKTKLLPLLILLFITGKSFHTLHSSLDNPPGLLPNIFSAEFRITKLAQSGEQTIAHILIKNS